MHKEKERMKNERKDDQEDQTTLATYNQHYS